MGKFSGSGPNAGAYGVPLSQASIDLGLSQWNPSMLDQKNPENSLMPAVGTGIRPRNMPRWVNLPPLREAYGERMQRLGIDGSGGEGGGEGGGGGGTLASALRELQNLGASGGGGGGGGSADSLQRYFVNKDGRHPISDQTYRNMGGRIEGQDQGD